METIGRIAVSDSTSYCAMIFDMTELRCLSATDIPIRLVAQLVYGKFLPITCGPQIRGLYCRASCFLTSRTGLEAHPTKTRYGAAFMVYHASLCNSGVPSPALRPFTCR